MPDCPLVFWLFFFFNDTATTEIYTLSLHDALPISARGRLDLRPRDDGARGESGGAREDGLARPSAERRDRKSTRLNSSHVRISYAVFCLKKKKFFSPTVLSCSAGLLKPKPAIHFQG